VNFDFSDEQAMLRDQARRFLADASSREKVRQWMDAGGDATAELWPQLAEMGWLGAAIDEAHGGLGLGVLELCVLAEEMGRALTPVPFFSTVCVAADLLGRCPPSGRRDELLQRIASGAAVVTLASAEAGEVWPGTLERSLPKTHLHGGKVSGEKAVVPDLLLATDLLVTVLDADNQPALVWVDAAAPGVQRDALEGFDRLRAHGRLQLVNAPAETLLAGPELAALLCTLRDRAAVIAAFEQLGTAESALILARDYTLQRYAFGRPLAGNQAVKHRLADMLVKNELARSNAYFGAWAAHVDSEELPRAAAAARLTATEALNFAAEESLHLHGGIGYTWEADCHLFLRRARLLAVQLGSTAAWSQRLLDASFEPTLVA
jgi:alkylation response protein AidB-like acyl-CoA dehydrogenase